MSKVIILILLITCLRCYSADPANMVVKFADERLSYGTVIGSEEGAIYFLAMQSEMEALTRPMIKEQRCFHVATKRDFKANMIGEVGRSSGFVFYLFHGEIGTIIRQELPWFSESGIDEDQKFSYIHDFAMSSEKSFQPTFLSEFIVSAKFDQISILGFTERDLPLGLGVPIFNMNNRLIGMSASLSNTPDQRQIHIVRIGNIRKLVFSFTLERKGNAKYSSCDYFNIGNEAFVGLTECEYERNSDIEVEESVNRQKQAAKAHKLDLQREEREIKKLRILSERNFLAPMLDFEFTTMYDRMAKKEVAGDSSWGFSPFGSNRRLRTGLSLQILPDRNFSFQIGTGITRTAIQLADTSSYFYQSLFNITKYKIINYTLSNYFGTRMLFNRSHDDYGFIICGQLYYHISANTKRLMRLNGNDQTDNFKDRNYFSYKFLIGWMSPYSEWSFGYERLMSPPNTLRKLEFQNPIPEGNEFIYEPIQFENYSRGAFVIQFTYRLYGTFSNPYKRDFKEQYLSKKRS